jgi:hypothetical protein
MDQLTIQVAEPGTDWRTVKKDLSADAPARGAPANDGPPGPAGPGQHSGVRGLRAAGRSGHALLRVGSCRDITQPLEAPLRRSLYTKAQARVMGPTGLRRASYGRLRKASPETVRARLFVLVAAVAVWRPVAGSIRAPIASDSNPPRVTAHLHQRTSQDPGDTFQRGLSVRQGGMARAIRKRLETIRRE